jgi:SAM-dependent methyltransferase
MGMNLFHRRLCRSKRWAEAVEQRLVPWTKRFDLGPEVLEIGPGYGATTRVLAARVPRLTVVEIDDELAGRLREQFGDTVRVVRGDGAALPLPDATYSAVTCFTMLHHVPSPERQDRLFGEACRVLRPGGLFAGFDSMPGVRFRLIHLGDTMVPIEPAALPDRLAGAGFVDIELRSRPGALLFSARKPASSRG